MLQMFYITVWGKAVEDWNSDEVLDNFYALADSPRMLGELIELLEYNYNKIDFIDRWDVLISDISIRKKATLFKFLRYCRAHGLR